MVLCEEIPWSLACRSSKTRQLTWDRVDITPPMCSVMQNDKMGGDQYLGFCFTAGDHTKGVEWRD